MEYRLDSYCGLYCGACDVLRANQKDTVTVVAEIWNMPADLLICHGCKSDVNSTFCRECDIRQCAEKRGVGYCINCEEYVCARLKAFRNDGCPHHATILHSLDLMKRVGVERWLSEQKTRWSCPDCGTEFCWYDKICTGCGRSLPSFTHEESDLAEV